MAPRLLLLVLLAGAVLGCAHDKTDGNLTRPASVKTQAAVSDMATDKFSEAYAAWQAHIKSPDVQLSSNPKAYTDCEAFRAISALGPDALGPLAGKIRQGAASGWAESEFFLWHAMRAISGVDLSSAKPYSGEQDMALRYADWWDAGKH